MLKPVNIYFEIRCKDFMIMTLTPMPYTMRLLGLLVWLL
jgi:hypothetical protein